MKTLVIAMLLAQATSDTPTLKEQAEERACAHLVDDMDAQTKRISMASCSIGFEYGILFTQGRKEP